MDDLVLLDLKALKVKREILDQMDLMVHLEMMESMGREDRLGLKERRESPVSKVVQGQEVRLESKAQKAILVLLVSLEILENRDLVVLRVNLVILVTMGGNITGVNFWMFVNPEYVQRGR